MKNNFTKNSLFSNFVLYTFILLPIVFTLGCKAISNINLYGIDEDIKLGKQVKEQIEADRKSFPILNNSQLKNYVQKLIDEILKSPEVKYKSKFAYKVEIIDNNDIINAFCTPGGYIYVYTGLIKFLDNEAALAAVLAHEIAHAECRHSTKRMSQSNVMSSIITEYKKKNDNKTTEALTNLGQSLALLNNSRDDEYEADELSFKYLKTSKWYPGGIKFFFDKIMAMYNAGGNRFEQLLATHPLPKDRIEKVLNLLKSSSINPPNESNLYYRQYQVIKDKFLK